MNINKAKKDKSVRNNAKQCETKKKVGEKTLSEQWV
jgi:hypothetical protein